MSAFAAVRSMFGALTDIDRYRQLDDACTLCPFCRMPHASVLHMVWQCPVVLQTQDQVIISSNKHACTAVRETIVPVLGPGGCCPAVGLISRLRLLVLSLSIWQLPHAAAA